MKYLLSILFSTNLFTSAIAQQDFQGKVIYTGHSTKPDNKDMELTIMFAPQKIKLLLKERENYDKEVLIINLDSGKIFTINTEDKTFKVKTLQDASTLPPAVDKIISGYNTRAIRPEQGRLGGLFAGFFNKADIIYYVSDSLIFTPPAKYSNNPELAMISNGHIVLGAEITISKTYADDGDAHSIDPGKKEMITITANKVIPELYIQNEFAVPDGYINEKDRIFSPETIQESEKLLPDSASLMVDTAKKYIPPKRRPVKRKAPKKATSTKSSTSMRKP